MAMGIVQSASSGVDAYISKILEEQANVDACVRLMDTECMFCLFMLITQLGYPAAAFVTLTEDYWAPYI
jgi:hypothetical protein